MATYSFYRDGNLFTTEYTLFTDALEAAFYDLAFKEAEPDAVSDVGEGTYSRPDLDLLYITRMGITDLTGTTDFG